MQLHPLYKYSFFFFSLFILYLNDKLNETKVCIRSILYLKDKLNKTNV